MTQEIENKEFYCLEGNIQTAEHSHVLGGVMASVLAIVPKVREFNTVRGRWIFKGDKNLQYAFLQRGSKAGDPM
jgi:hypothetical protein